MTSRFRVPVELGLRSRVLKLYVVQGIEFEGLGVFGAVLGTLVNRIKCAQLQPYALNPGIPSPPKALNVFKPERANEEDHTVHLGRMMRTNTTLTELYLGKHRCTHRGRDAVRFSRAV